MKAIMALGVMFSFVWPYAAVAQKPPLMLSVSCESPEIIKSLLRKEGMVPQFKMLSGNIPKMFLSAPDGKWVWVHIRPASKLTGFAHPWFWCIWDRGNKFTAIAAKLAPTPAPEPPGWDDVTEPKPQSTPPRHWQGWGDWLVEAAAPGGSGGGIDREGWQ
jgi:hypothetical protein